MTFARESAIESGLMPQDVITFGCRLNAYESEIIRKNLEQSGVADIAVFNTCAVTKEAERQARQAIRRYKRENPQAEIVVTGCAAQISPGAYANMPEVTRVMGNEEKLKPFQFNEERIQVNDIMSVTATAHHMVASMEGRTRAFLQVQNGCNHRCTFCIIPYGRGNSRSVPMGEIVEHARKLVAEGYRELVLTGVDITSYGQDLPGTPTLGQMMKRLLSLVNIPRLRLSSVDVAEMDEALMELIATEKRLMPHFHLSLQAGDNMILKRMKRRHTREDAIEWCRKVKAMRPDAVFGADIIAGFPTETDEMFQNTLDIVEEAGLIYLHVFPYSEREGTPAAKIPNQVPVPVRKERAKLLREAGEKQLAKYLESLVGKTLPVLVESEGMGRTEGFAQVRVDQELEPGKIILLRLDKKSFRLN